MAVVELATVISPELVLVDPAAPTNEEVISPELALVDPELRARALARLDDEPRWAVRPPLRLVLPPDDEAGATTPPAPAPMTLRLAQVAPGAPSTPDVPQRSELAVATAVYFVVSAVHFAVWGLVAVAVIALSVVLAILV